MRDARATPLLEPLSEDERFASWHIVVPDRGPVGHGRGAIALLRSLGSTRLAAHALDLVPDPVLDGLYAVVARNRGRLGRLVPDRAGPDRYP
jgi:predicted DCC family thiol-disulfide oxidoreductase YuxK